VNVLISQLVCNTLL